MTGQTPAYDPNFNLTRYNGWTYVYDADGRLTSASATGHSAQFTYDGLGRCVKRTIDGVTMTIAHDGWKPIVEWDGTGNLVAWNLYGAGADEILMRYQVNIGFLHYHLDRQGNVAFLLNASNTGIEKYTYDAFGQPKITDWSGNVRTTSAYANRFMFTGREYLTALGIYDYRNRFYLPSLGRFLQSDPIGFAGGDNNLFRYCAGDPVNRRDPMGTQGFFIPRDGEIQRGDLYMMNTYGLGPPIGDDVYADIAQQQLEDFQFYGEVALKVGELVIDIAADHFFMEHGLMLDYMGDDPTASPYSPPDARNHSDSDVSHEGGYGFLSVSGSSGFDYVGYSTFTAVSGAINALNAYGQAHGPGIGIITATSNDGTTVLAAGPVGGQSYAGAVGSGLTGGTYGGQQFGGGNFGGAGPNGFGGLGAGFGGIGGGFTYGIGGQGFGGVGNNSTGVTFGGGPLKKF